VAYALVRAASALVPTPGRLFSVPQQVSRRASTQHARVRAPRVAL